MWIITPVTTVFISIYMYTKTKIYIYISEYLSIFDTINTGS
jgi:uncharacterized membrane protein